MKPIQYEMKIVSCKRGLNLSARLLWQAELQGASRDICPAYGPLETQDITPIELTTYKCSSNDCCSSLNLINSLATSSIS